MNSDVVNQANLGNMLRKVYANMGYDLRPLKISRTKSGYELVGINYRILFSGLKLLYFSDGMGQFVERVEVRKSSRIYSDILVGMDIVIQRKAWNGLWEDMTEFQRQLELVNLDNSVANFMVGLNNEGIVI